MAMTKFKRLCLCNAWSGLAKEVETEAQARDASSNAVEEAERAQTCWKDMQSNMQSRNEKIASQEARKLLCSTIEQPLGCYRNYIPLDATMMSKAYL